MEQAVKFDANNINYTVKQLCDAVNGVFVNNSDKYNIINHFLNNEIETAQLHDIITDTVENVISDYNFRSIVKNVMRDMPTEIVNSDEVESIVDEKIKEIVNDKNEAIQQTIENIADATQDNSKTVKDLNLKLDAINIRIDRLYALDVISANKTVKELTSKLDAANMCIDRLYALLKESYKLIAHFDMENSPKKRFE
ncbi:MAG: hypothetical protein AABY32_01130 [Nanoarchaeota archaeon]